MMTPAVFHTLVARLGAILVVSSISACGSSRGDAKAGDSTPPAVAPDTAYGAAAVVARSEWCLKHGCVAETVMRVDSNVVNHPFSLPIPEQAAVEVQTRDSVLIGAGLMLWNAGHKEGAETQASLLSFAKSVIGDCPVGLRHVESKYTTEATGIMNSPSVVCGRWEVRTGKVPNGFYVSVDEAVKK